MLHYIFAPSNRSLTFADSEGALLRLFFQNFPQNLNKKNFAEILKCQIQNRKKILYTKNRAIVQVVASSNQKMQDKREWDPGTTNYYNVLFAW